MQDPGEVCLQGPMSSPFAGHGGQCRAPAASSPEFRLFQEGEGAVGSTVPVRRSQPPGKASLNLSSYMQVFLTVRILSLPEDLLSQREAVVHTNFL